MASNNFINECKNGAYCNRYGKLEFDGLTITEDNQLVDFNIVSGCYDNGDIIGNTYVKKIEANLLDSITDDLVDKDFEASVGAKYTVTEEVEGEEVETEVTEYVDLGTYTIEKPTDTQTENRTSLIGYSQLLDNLDKLYETQLDYENDTITIADVYEELCDNLGLTPESLIFTNSTIEVEGNPFTNGEKNRDVLRSIEKTSCSFVDIDPTTNEISLKWLSSNLDYTFTLDDYSTLEGGKVVYGPINSLIIRNSQIESENVSISDQESIEEYGEHQFVIIEDYFLYNATKRQEALQDIWAKVHNLTYVDCKLTTYTGKPFLNVGDKIRVYTDENNYFDTYILKHKFTFNGAFMSEIESPVLTQQEVKTKQDISLGEKLRNTQIVVDKAKGEIDQVVTAIGDNGEVTSASIVTAINNDTSQIKLDADKIYINGVTFDSQQKMTMTDGTITLEDNPETDTIPSISITTSNDNNSKISLWSKKINSTERYGDYTTSNRYVEGYGLSHYTSSNDKHCIFQVGRATEIDTASANLGTIKEGIRIEHRRSHSGNDYTTSMEHSKIQIWDKNQTSSPVVEITEKNSNFKGTMTINGDLNTNNILGNTINLVGNATIGGNATISNSISGQKATLTCKKNDTNKQIEFGVGAGGTNRGIFDEGQQKWLFYTDDTNTYINSSGATYIDGKKTSDYLNDSGWVNCTTSKGTWSYCQVRKIGKVVHLRGYATSLGAPSGTIFTIPSGYRPSQAENAFGQAGWVSAPTISRWYFNTDGACGMDWNLSLVNGTNITENTWKRVSATWFVD